MSKLDTGFVGSIISVCLYLKSVFVVKSLKQLIIELKTVEENFVAKNAIILMLKDLVVLLINLLKKTLLLLKRVRSHGTIKLVKIYNQTGKEIMSAMMGFTIGLKKLLVKKESVIFVKPRKLKCIIGQAKTIFINVISQIGNVSA